MPQTKKKPNSAAKQMVNSQVKIIKHILTSRNTNNLALAIELYILKQMPLKLLGTSFAEVCRDELDLTKPDKHVSMIQNAYNLGYKNNQLYAIAKQVPFTRMRMLMHELVSKITVKQFIAAARAMKTAQYASAPAIATNPQGVAVRYQLWVDPKRAKKLDTVLASYGMVIKSGTRQGVTNAFATLIDNL